MTLVARQCTGYPKVRANRARNNIMQSLQNLGPDTNYTDGEAISVAKESAAPQDPPNCVPLVGWQFGTGTGIGSVVSGRWGGLSSVNGTGRTIGPTEASIPLRNPNGSVSGQPIAGAVSTELTQTEFNSATKRQLWVQGGLRTDPVMNAAFPDKYEFAALRCAVDNLNGDNVEWIGYPQNAKHVLCYAYYIDYSTPPPVAGTITVVKNVTSSPPVSPFAPDQDFRFTGDISYTVPPAFTLKVRGGNPASQSFVRAAAQTWNFAEDATAGWTLTSFSCASDPGAPGGSTFAYNVGARSTAVTLGSADRVTCTYTNDFAQPPVFRVFKTTSGGTGSFDITAVGTSGVPAPFTATGTVTTTAEDTPVALDLSGAGDGNPYTVSEKLSAGMTGVWRLTRIECDGVDIAVPAPNVLSTSTPVTFTAPDNPSACSLTNTLDPPGSITVRKKAIGATETVIYAISDPGSDKAFLQLADVNVQDKFITALPIDPAIDATDDLPLGTYQIQQLSGSADDTFNNEIVALTCNGAAVTPDAEARWNVTLTAGVPSVTCDITDQLTEVSPSTTIATTTTTEPATTTTTTVPPSTTAAPGGTAKGTGTGQGGSLAATGARNGLLATILNAVALTCLGGALVAGGLLARRRLEQTRQ